MRNITLFLVGILLLVSGGKEVLAVVSTTEEANLTCQKLWWFDGSTKVCAQRSFCGAYMYQGLRTFGTQAECVKNLPMVNCSLKKCGDANCDGLINTQDLMVWMRERNSAGRTADFNGDGKVDVGDYDILKNGIVNGCKTVPTKIPTKVPTKVPTPVGKCTLNSLTPLISCNVNESGEKSYRYIQYKCGNGVLQKMGSASSCKTYSMWKLYASDACKKSCPIITPTRAPTKIPTKIPTRVPSPYLITPTLSTSPSVIISSNPPANNGVVTLKRGQLVNINIKVFNIPGTLNVDYTRSLFYGPTLSCSNTDWVMNCTSYQVGEGEVYVEVNKGDKMYRSNKIVIKVLTTGLTPTVHPTSTNAPTPNFCQFTGDADGDGKVTINDYGIWKSEYMSGKKNKADFDCSGTIDLADYAIWKKMFLAAKNN